MRAFSASVALISVNWASIQLGLFRGYRAVGPDNNRLDPGLGFLKQFFTALLQRRTPLVAAYGLVKRDFSVFQAPNECSNSESASSKLRVPISRSGASWSIYPSQTPKAEGISRSWQELPGQDHRYSPLSPRLSGKRRLMQEESSGETRNILCLSCWGRPKQRSFRALPPQTSQSRGVASKQRFFLFLLAGRFHHDVYVRADAIGQRGQIVASLQSGHHAAAAQIVRNIHELARDPFEVLGFQSQLQ